ncbi:hypothetical protein [Helicobacter pylori]|uniref:hypothetical protein n=1 Tax=Helicobacter pylori TaxID=210 RepID=UPI0002BB6580|nr:hypothetical protein [Helicobacter pylori]
MKSSKPYTNNTRKSFSLKNASKVLVNKDGSDLANAQTIKDKLQHRIEKTKTQEMLKGLGSGFINRLKPKIQD